MTNKCIYISTFGWPLVQVPRYDFRGIKEGKCFGMKKLRKISIACKLFLMLHNVKQC